MNRRQFKRPEGALQIVGTQAGTGEIDEYRIIVSVAKSGIKRNKRRATVKIEGKATGATHRRP